MVTFTIDGKECKAEKGKTVVQAAKDNHVFIPVLCDFEGLPPAATCRLCNVKINGKPTTACTTPVAEGMEIECDTEELNEKRKMIIEMLFVEGNHFCPSCEKSGNCELQAYAYKYQMMAPRFSYQFTRKDVDASTPKLVIEKNRCILCRRCVRGIRTEDDKALFTFVNRGDKAEIFLDRDQAMNISDELAEKAMDMCPVGAIIKKEKGFTVPVGQRKFDKKPIGSDIENG
ncbi:MAG: 2Fe-2S iron-sulfur cluster-binding protein [Chitinivibrionales bacterium]